MLGCPCRQTRRSGQEDQEVHRLLDPPWDQPGQEHLVCRRGQWAQLDLPTLSGPLDQLDQMIQPLRGHHLGQLGQVDLVHLLGR